MLEIVRFGVDTAWSCCLDEENQHLCSILLLLSNCWQDDQAKPLRLALFSEKILGLRHGQDIGRLCYLLYPCIKLSS